MNLPQETLKNKGFWVVGVIRDTKGNWIICFIGNLSVITNIRAEPLALLKGLQMALSKSLAPLEINTNCQVLISMLSDNHLHYKNMILDCKALILQLRNPPILHGYSKMSQMAVQLAREGASMMIENNTTFCEVPPLFLQQTLKADKARSLFVRLNKKHPTTSILSPL